jgi:hypothetical protein
MGRDDDTAVLVNWTNHHRGYFGEPVIELAIADTTGRGGSHKRNPRRVIFDQFHFHDEEINGKPIGTDYYTMSLEEVRTLVQLLQAALAYQYEPDPKLYIEPLPGSFPVPGLRHFRVVDGDDATSKEESGRDD